MKCACFHKPFWILLLSDEYKERSTRYSIFVKLFWSRSGFHLYIFCFIMSWKFLINTLKFSTYFIFSIVVLTCAYFNGSIVYLNETIIYKGLLSYSFAFFYYTRPLIRLDSVGKQKGKQRSTFWNGTDKGNR